MAVIAKYRLKKDLPRLKAGAIFEHRDWDPKYPERGNPGCGALLLGWLDGSCQQGWCGDTFVFPGQIAKEKEWFEPLEQNLKEKLLYEIEYLKERVNKLTV